MNSDNPKILRRGERTGHREWTAKAQRGLHWISPLLLLGLWELMAKLGELDARFFPPPSDIVKSAGQVLNDGSLARATTDSLRRLGIGYGIGAAAGAPPSTCTSGSACLARW